MGQEQEQEQKNPEQKLDALKRLDELKKEARVEYQALTKALDEFERFIRKVEAQKSRSDLIGLAIDFRKQERNAKKIAEKLRQAIIDPNELFDLDELFDHSLSWYLEGSDHESIVKQNTDLEDLLSLVEAFLQDFEKVKKDLFGCAEILIRPDKRSEYFKTFSKKNSTKNKKQTKYREKLNASSVLFSSKGQSAKNTSPKTNSDDDDHEDLPDLQEPFKP